MTLIADNGEIKGTGGQVHTLSECCSAVRFIMDEMGFDNFGKFMMASGILFSSDQLEKMNSDEVLNEKVEKLMVDICGAIEIVKMFVDQY